MQVLKIPITGIRTAEISNAPKAEPIISELYEPAAIADNVPSESFVAIENCVPVNIPETKTKMKRIICTIIPFAESESSENIATGRRSVKTPVTNWT